MRCAVLSITCLFYTVYVILPGVNVNNLADGLKSDLTHGESQGQSLRLVRQFVMDLERSDNPEELFAETPESTSDLRWDALIAGVVEDFAFEHGLVVPAWTLKSSRFLDRWWFVTSVPALYTTAMLETPAALANRGVFIQRASLVNV